MYIYLRGADGATIPGVVRRVSDHADIPADPGNLDWQAFETWLAEGNVPSEPAPLPIPVPASVEDWQFAGQAAEEGIITRTEALDWSGAGIVPPTLIKAVDKLVTDEAQHFKVMIFLRGSKSFPRNHGLVPLLGRVFGKNDDAALDAFWTAAGQR